MSSFIEILNGVATLPAGAAASPVAGPYRTPPRISVVVPTYHRDDLLANCLQALLAQTLPRDAYEILVVDDGRSDDTGRAVEAIAERNPDAQITYLRPESGRGPAVARNRGWRAARGELIAFTDDDTTPTADWLENGEREMQKFPWVAVGGRIQVPRPQGGARPPTDHELMTIGLEDTEFVTANAFARCRCAASTSASSARGARTPTC